ncbi:unnamed protein product, partial [Mesorhabditis belari]|uniref:Dynein light chain n=1 Tax=Mesorhabditis belari TaxID=2138241 RepID=A0AAF3ES63_9BILA
MTEVEQLPQTGVFPPEVVAPHLETEHIFIGQRDAVIKNSDMPEELQADAIELAQQALDRFKLEKEMAAFIKTEFDKRHYPSWQVVVGSNFGSYVTHETNRFTYFYIAHIAFMLYKTGI